MSSNNCNHCVPDSGDIPRMILTRLWSQSDNNDNNNNSAIFIRLLNTKRLDRLVLPGALPTAQFDFVIVIT